MAKTRKVQDVVLSHETFERQPLPAKIRGRIIKAKQPVQVQPESTVDIAKRTMVLSLSFAGPGDSRRIDSKKIEVAGDHEKKTDKSWVNASKTLFDCPEYDAIWSVDGKVHAYIQNTALPGFLKKGFYLVPNKLVDAMTTRLQEFAEERRARVAEFKDVYEASITEAHKRLGPLFDPDDYIAVESLEDRFTMTWHYIELVTPSSLKQISNELYEQEKTKAEAEWAETREVCKATLRAEMAEFVAHLIERLKPGADGKQKSIHKNMLPNFESFLGLFDARNITEDGQLKAIVDRAKKALDGVDTETLKTDAATREQVSKGFAELHAALDPLIVDRPRRLISFK